jgi:hypothetical protein
MHIVTLAQGPYTASIVGGREEKRGQIYETFLVPLLTSITAKRELSPITLPAYLSLAD